MLDTTPFTHHTFIAVNGIELEVFEAGTEHRGNPIVLCHGWPELAYSWRHQVPALVAAGFHVIAPNQRGFGRSSAPASIAEYDILHLTGDLVALLDHFDYENAVFMGHDWGANVVWNLAMLHPKRVSKFINLALPYQVRTEKPWIKFLEEMFGPDHYFVHFNRQVGVADAVLDANAQQFLNNLYRKNIPMVPPEPGMMMINLAQSKSPLGEPVLTEHELQTYVSAFQHSGFTGGINWYRNLDANWHAIADVDPIIHHPALMIYGTQDMIPKLENIRDFVPNIEEVSLDCGHWIQQERPDETNRIVVDWLTK